MRLFSGCSAAELELVGYWFSLVCTFYTDLLLKKGLKVSLTCKGIAQALPSSPLQAQEFEWDWLVHKDSPHASMVWKPQLPCLIYKGFWYAESLQDITDNLGSLMWGFGVRSNFHSTGGNPKSGNCSTSCRWIM